MPTTTGEMTWLSPQDLYLFNEGSHVRLYEKLGAHPCVRDGKPGFHFAVWAPNAEYVSVVGDFNYWDKGADPMEPIGSSGVWGRFVPNVGSGVCYKYHVSSRHMGYKVEKGDPYAFTCEVPLLQLADEIGNQPFERLGRSLRMRRRFLEPNERARRRIGRRSGQRLRLVSEGAVECIDHIFRSPEPPRQGQPRNAEQRADGLQP